MSPALLEKAENACEAVVRRGDGTVIYLAEEGEELENAKVSNAESEATVDFLEPVHSRLSSPQEQ